MLCQCRSQRLGACWPGPLWVRVAAALSVAVSTAAEGISNGLNQRNDAATSIRWETTPSGAPQKGAQAFW